jgi:tRNA (cytidine/uridine-2'-O-)-methyltransferase
MRRAGLDYREFADVTLHDGFESVAEWIGDGTAYAFSQHAPRLYTDVGYEPGDVLIFGKESVGLPQSVMAHAAIADCLRIPIAAGGRSLNLANAAAIVIYEAWRQNGFG